MTIRNVAVAVGLALASSVASANVTYTFTADGVTNSTAQAGTAMFDFSNLVNGASTLTLTLTNNVSPTQFIASELDGFLFTLSTAAGTETLLSISAPSVINCNNVAGSSCPAGAGSSPYGWGSTMAGDDVALGAGFDNSNNTFAYHPYGIVNTNYVAPGGNGGLSNAQHNPLLVGPTTFTFALTGLSFIPEVSSVTFLFGTVPDSQLGVTCTGCDSGPTGITSVPEPNTLALIGLGMLSVAWAARRKTRSA